MMIAQNQIEGKNTPLAPPPKLKHYMVGPEIETIIQHNLRWAKGKEDRPEFKFAYLMLPTRCNLRCMGCFTGKDKGRLPESLDGPFYSKAIIAETISFLKEHNAEAIVYGGGGELFTWKGARGLISQITAAQLGMVIFTNGTLLKKETVKWLSEQDISLIISMRDIAENEHDEKVGVAGAFKKTWQVLEWAIEYGMQKDQRLAVEMPVTKCNEERILEYFIPLARKIGAIPFVEEFIQIMVNSAEKAICHNFKQARRFFEKAREVDAALGYEWKNEFGQRVVAQPMCKRPLYSFAIYPNGTVANCPSCSIAYGNMYKNKNGLEGVIYSPKFREELLKFSLCACSVFYAPQSEKSGKLSSYLK